MDQLTQVLASLGPWGMVAAFVIPLVVNYLRTGQVIPPKSPAAPAGGPAGPGQPSAPVAPAAPVVITGRPLIDVGLQFLQLLRARQVQRAQAPVSPYAAVQYDQLDALEDDVMRRVAESAAQPK